MIYTCTVNPSLDYYLNFDGPIKSGLINRAVFEDFDAGGKGVNVSIVLNNLMIPNVALGFLGGFTREFYLSFIKKHSYIEPLFTTIKDVTRINLKILADEAIDINAKGPHITNEEFERFEKRLYRIYPGDVFVLSGNVQTELFDRIVKIIHDLSASGVKIVLDTNSEVVAACYGAKPFLVRMNHEDLLKLSGVENDEAALKQLLANEIQQVIVPIEGKGSLFACGDGLYTCVHKQEKQINTTGMSDSMVAGYLYAIQKGANALEAFRYANAAGAATLGGGGLADRIKTEEKYQNLSVERMTL